MGVDRRDGPTGGNMSEIENSPKKSEKAREVLKFPGEIRKTEEIENSLSKLATRTAS